MTVTKIESVTKTRYKIFLDGQFTFVLYKGELSRYRITEGTILDEYIVKKIQTEIILKRAKQRALHLLTDMPRTEHQLRTKLKQGLYTDDIIEQTLEYVKSFGYIEDRAYTERYIQNRGSSKSRKELSAELYRKGISKEIIDEIMEEYFESGEEEAIRTILKKKDFSPEEADEKQKSKMFAYLIRKGFRYEDVRRMIQVSEWNT